MALKHPNPREQDQSIRARKQMLFEEDDLATVASETPSKPFVEYLTATPAAPLSAGVKASLWAAGVVVMLLLVAALMMSAG